MQALTGQTIDRYHVLEQIGEGGMAVVYKAYDTRLEREVAIKIIRKEAFPAEVHNRIFKRFEREAKSLARLSHPNIIKVHDYGEYEGSPYLVMEYQPGGTLKSLLGTPLPWNEVSKYIIPLAKALGYAHQQGILHRDVKPSNILITTQGEPMLTDFGIAKILDISEGQTLTGTGIGVGTPEYMAPEQGLGKEVDGRVDVYSLGVILYELITGRKPYTADTPMAVLFKHMTDPLPRPGDVLPGIPEDLECVILKALAKDPVNRYQSMAELVSAMERVSQNSNGRSKLVNKPPIPSILSLEAHDALSNKAKQNKNLILAISGVFIIFSMMVLFINKGRLYLGVSQNIQRNPEIMEFVQTQSATPIEELTKVAPTINQATVTEFSANVTPERAITVELPIEYGSSTASPTPTSDGQLCTGNQPIEFLRQLINRLNAEGLWNRFDGDVISFSDDFKLISFVSYESGNAEIYTYDPCNQNTKQITKFQGKKNPTHLSISPDGTKIAFQDYIGDWKYEIVVIDKFGNDLFRLSNPKYTNESPIWSPDSKKVLFVTNRDGNNEIYIAENNGSNVTRVTNNLNLDDEPSWSIDGEKIVFSRQINTRIGNNDLFVVNLVDGNEVRLTESSKEDESPKFSPDGNHIAFSLGKYPNYTIYIMDADGSGKKQVVFNDKSNFSPQWLPDGRNLLFISESGGSVTFEIEDVSQYVLQ